MKSPKETSQTVTVNWIFKRNIFQDMSSVAQYSWVYFFCILLFFFCIFSMRFLITLLVIYLLHIFFSMLVVTLAHQSPHSILFFFHSFCFIFQNFKYFLLRKDDVITRHPLGVLLSFSSLEKHCSMPSTTPGKKTFAFLDWRSLT